MECKQELLTTHRGPMLGISNSYDDTNRAPPLGGTRLQSTALLRDIKTRPRSAAAASNRIERNKARPSSATVLRNRPQSATGASKAGLKSSNQQQPSKRVP